MNARLAAPSQAGNVIKKINSLEKRLDKQDKILLQINNTLKQTLKEIKINSHIQTGEVTSSAEGISSFGNMPITYGEVPNAWALQTSRSLSAEVNILKRDVRQRFADRALSAYKPTLNALRDHLNGLTAAEVGKLTRRNRNTESAYLWRLHLANLVDREKNGNKIIYKLSNPDINVP